MRLLLASVLLPVAALAANPTPAIPGNVPTGRAPMADTHLSGEEWRGAGRVELPGGAQLWLLQNDDYIFLCVRGPRPSVFGVDLFIADSTGRVVDLRAAAQLGERTAEAGKWPAEWTWWNNVGWTATIVPYELKDGRPEFLPTAGKEFQLSKRRFSDKTYRIRLTYQFGRDGAPLTFPVGALDVDPVNWFQINL